MDKIVLTDLPDGTVIGVLLCDNIPTKVVTRKNRDLVMLEFTEKTLARTN